MAFPCCFSSQSQLAFKGGFLGHGPRLPCKMMAIQNLRISHTNVETEPFSLQSGQIPATVFMRTNVETELFSLQSGRIRTTAFMRPNLDRTIEYRRISTVSASCLPSTQLASSVFTLGTAAVLPFYTLMIVAPKAEVTKKLMASSLPYIALGLLYAYLLYLSWTPDTIRLMCSGKNFLPELPAIAKLFSNEMTLASAWIHLLAIDLFAARQVFHDGLQENVETRHSVSLCLFFCPIGVFTHFLTKAISKTSITKGGAGN